MNVVEYVKEDEQFYPTPEWLVNRMIEGVDWNYIQTILEPSAGTGNILREIAKKEARYYSRHFDVDCIEIDRNLAQILKYNFSSERKDEIRSKIREIESTQKYDSVKRCYNEYTPEQKAKLAALRQAEQQFFDNGIHLVHDDFLTFQSFKKYDLIIMNPPFADGDKHLLKALKIQEKGGAVICLLNAETILNPYSTTRKELKKELEKHNATIEFIKDAFVDGERKADVDVALIKVYIEKAVPESDIYKNLEKAENYKEYTKEEITDLEVTDYIKAFVGRFNMEVKCGLELIKQYEALKPYALHGLNMTLQSNNKEISVNSYLKSIRLKYWETLLADKRFTGKLTSKLQSEYRSSINNLANYDFTEFNIYNLAAEMNAQVKTGIEDEIMSLFDKMTAEHSYFPESKNNKHLYDGWKTNKAHKIGKKVILPCYGIFDSWDGRPRTYNAVDTLQDIEKVLNFLDGNMTLEVDLRGVLNNYFERGITKKVPCKFFNATFYKKGTVHLEFTNSELIERFNIYAAQNRAWLPPNYGKTTYQNMTNEEKAVVDSFQGEKAYNEVMAKSNYYLASVGGNQMLQLA